MDTISQNTDTSWSQVLTYVPSMYRHRIVDQYNAIKDNYPVQSHVMPQPLWKQRGYDHSGDTVWEHIQTLFSDHTFDPVCIYVHIPFCQKKCGFCDCLSVPLDEQSPVNRFVSVLIDEIRAWARLPGLKQRPVSVLYFGGGTPNSLPDGLFEQILRTLKEEFKIQKTTQISVECNAHLLTAERMRLLRSWGVNRISIGVQTLEEPLRFKLGRHSDASKVLSTIKQCKTLGFTTCADVIYGLPEQTIHSFLNTLQSLVDADIDGLSLYRFNLRQQNKAFIKKTFSDFKVDNILNYVYFQTGHCLLTDAGYHKNHFIHFVRNDDNLYYRHMLRNEDLIALGPTADGIIDSYRYRHPNLHSYLIRNHGHAPVFEGGITEPVKELEIRPLTVALMCGEIHDELARSFRLNDLLRTWQLCRIVTPDEKDGYRLTANGSWLLDQLLAKVRSLSCV